MSDPLSALALAAGKRVLWRTVLKVVAWCLPVVLVGVLVLVVYATVLAGGEDADGAGGFGACGGGVEAPGIFAASSQRRRRIASSAKGLARNVAAPSGE